MKAGDKVYLKHDPGRRGTLTERERVSAGRRRVQVEWNTGGSQYVPEDQLVVINPDAVQASPLDYLRTGQLASYSTLRRLLTHKRLSGKLADIIYSMNTTGTKYYPFQFKPLVKLLNSATDGILIADEVGLGKTIEAGLIWTEIRHRFDFRNLLVVCPAMLREKWKRELIQRFGVDAEIVNAGQALDRFKRSIREGYRGGFSLIGSMQGLRPTRNWSEPDNERKQAQLGRFLEDQRNEAPFIDLTIIDEAHYLRNRSTMTNRLAHWLRDVSKYVILLSATPIHLRNDDLYQLLNLVDEYTFDRVDAFKEIMEATKVLVRIKEGLLGGGMSHGELIEELQSARNNSLLKESQQLKNLIDNFPSEDELDNKEVVSQIAGRLETMNPMGHVVSRTRKVDVKERKVIRKVIPEEVTLAAEELELYENVTDLVREYCERYSGTFEGFLLVTPQRQLASSMPAALLHWRQKALLQADQGSLGDDEGEQVSEDIGVEPGMQVGRRSPPEEVGPLTQALVDRIDDLGDFEVLKEVDSKYKRLAELLSGYFKEYPGEKVVLFSYFRATIGYLNTRLAGDGFDNFVLKGGMEDKDQIIDDFMGHEGSAILLSTEVGSEGIDLQFCRVVINYDLPWNPMKVEQRIGRIDRIGQEADTITVWNLFSADTIDSRIYNRLFARLNIFEEALGPLEPILGEEIGKLTKKLMSPNLTPEQEVQMIEQTAQALFTIRRHTAEMEEEASDLIYYGDFILDQVTAAEELARTITDKDLQVYVTDYFKVYYKGSELRQNGNGEYRFDINLSTQAKHDLEHYMRGEQLDLSTALLRPSVRRVDCEFKNSAVARSDGKVETISQFHPLVRFVSHKLKLLEEEPVAAETPEVPSEDELDNKEVASQVAGRIDQETAAEVPSEGSAGEAPVPGEVADAPAEQPGGAAVAGGSQKRPPHHPASALKVVLSQDKNPQNLVAGIYVYAAQRWSVSGIQNIEKLYYSVAPLDGSGEPFSAYDSERLVMAGVNHGEEWRGYRGTVDFEQAYRVADSICMERCYEAFDEFEKDLKAKNGDRANIRRTTLDNRFRSQVEGLKIRLQRFQDKNQLGPARMMEGQIRARTAAYEKRVMEIEDKRETHGDAYEVCVGLIKVELETS